LEVWDMWPHVKNKQSAGQSGRLKIPWPEVYMQSKLFKARAAGFERTESR